MTLLEAAQAAVEKAQRDFEVAKARWEAAISKHLDLENQIAARPVAVNWSLTSANFGQLLSREKPGEKALLAQLRAQEEEARRQMDAAGNSLVEARQAERRAQFRTFFEAAHLRA